jgi:hypothetical protein
MSGLLARITMSAALLLAMGGGLHSFAAQGKPVAKPVWRAATASELEAVMPERAPVVNERIETEAASSTGITDGRGHVIGAIVLITAGYAANGKYSHYLLAQSGLRIGQNIVLKPGAYVIGWTREPDGLLVHVYDAATGMERGSVTAKVMEGKVTVVPVKIWPPAEKGVIQIGRFAMPYAVTEDR